MSISDEWRVTAQRVFELAINAKLLWNSGSVEERVKILKQLCSNPVLNGLTIEYYLKKPFGVVAEMSSKKDWRPQGD